MKKYIKSYIDYSSREALDKNLSYAAEDIADKLEAFLDATTRIENLDDYLDEYDLEHLDKAHDALFDFASMYAHDQEYRSK